MAETSKERYLWIKALKDEISKGKNQLEEKDDIAQVQVKYILFLRGIERKLDF